MLQNQEPKACGWSELIENVEPFSICFAFIVRSFFNTQALIWRRFIYSAHSLLKKKNSRILSGLFNDCSEPSPVDSPILW